MNAPASLSELARELDAALDWWRLAGVDADYAEDATDWLAGGVGQAAVPAVVDGANARQEAPARSRPESATKKPVERIGGDPSEWPGDLESFREWLATEASLDEGGIAPRIPSAGEAGAALMILVTQPEADDRETLLSGAQGRLLDNMLAAMGTTRGETYLASALLRHTPLPDWHALDVGGLGALLSHHIGLVKPQRLLVLGRRILPLLPHDTAQGSVALREFTHDKVGVGCAAAAGLETLLDRPDERARFWRRWLEWAGTTAGRGDDGTN